MRLEIPDHGGPSETSSDKAEQLVAPVKSRKRGVKAYKSNPFLEPSEITTKRKRIRVSGGKAVIDVETGAIEDLAEIVVVRQVDEEQFVKLFTQNLSVFFNLSPIALKLIQVILAQVQRLPNRDQIMLNLTIAEEYFIETAQKPLSRASFYRAVHELLEKRFIAETILTGLYFINPHLFFNGDRVRFIQEYQRKKSDVKYAKTVEALQQSTLAVPQLPKDSVG